MVFASINFNVWGWLDMIQNGNGKLPKKPIHGFRTRYFSRHFKVDISIPEGIFRRLKTWMDNHWKLAAWRSAITILALFPTLYGISLGNMTIADKTRLSVLEAEAESGKALESKVASLENILKLKIIDYNKLDVRITALEIEVAVRKEVNEEDGKILERQAQEERDRLKRQQLEERNKARAEKLKRIGQADEFRAVPLLPSPSIYPIFRGIKND